MRYSFIRTNTARKYILVLIALLSFGRLAAQSTDQNFPVTAQAFIVAQPNQQLSAYFSSSQALTVNLLLKDLTKTSIQVYLRWSLDGPGVRLSSMDGYIPANLITLQRGMMQRLSGLELQNDYFRSHLIEQQGFGGATNPLRSTLPEGFYTFRVQALEAGTGREVSNLGETYFSITTPLPPVINIPFNGAELNASTPLSMTNPVQIQWMPRHYKQAGNITSYDLKVCKVPDGFEPQEALDACVNPIIDDKGNPGTFYPGNTGIGNSIIGAFEQGARYAVRVTVHEFDRDGQQVVFANEGRSEVTWFRYGAQCMSPLTFAIKETGPGRLSLTWESQPSAATSGYHVYYRKEGSSVWSSQNVLSTTAQLSGLTSGKYELVVQSACSDIMPANAQVYELEDQEDQELPSVLQNPLLTQVSATLGGQAVSVDSLHKLFDKIKIPCAAQISAYESCEAPLPSVNPTGTQPLNILKPGDVLSIYDMAVIVTETNGSPGFSGKGFARIPSLKNTLTPVEFSGVHAWKPEDGSNGGCVYQVDGYFRTYTIQTAPVQQNPVFTSNDSVDKNIRYVVVSPVTTTYASVSWLGVPSVKKYIIKYAAPTGGELQQETSDLKTTLINLREATKYSFSIEAYDSAGKLLDKYGPDTFVTATSGIAMPENLNPVWKDSLGRLTWDANPTHKKFVLKYLNKNGIQKTVYPTTNVAEVDDLDDKYAFPFTLIAIGNTNTGMEIESAPATGTFNARIATDSATVDGGNLDPATIIGHAEPDTKYTPEIQNGTFSEDAMYANQTNQELSAIAPVLNPESPTAKAWKKISTYTYFDDNICPPAGRSLPKALKVALYAGYVAGEIFKGIAHLVLDTGELIIDNVLSPLASGIQGFVTSLVENVLETMESNPDLTVDDVFEQVALKLTIIEIAITPTTNEPVEITMQCSPVPSWIKNIRECELEYIKDFAGSKNLPILVVDEKGDPVDLPEAKETSTGDYYYHDRSKGIEYWKLQGTYLIARIKGSQWVYRNSYVNKWCAFTPTPMTLRVTETTNVCDDPSKPSLGGEISVQVLNGKGPYTFSASDGRSSVSDSPSFTYDQVGGSLDLTVKDSKGCVAMLKDQTLQIVPGTGLDLAVKLRNCSNSAIVTPVCGTGPFSYSMDDKKYQTSNEFTGIQDLIGPKGESTNGLTKTFTFFIKDARGRKASRTMVIKRNDYITMGVRDVGNQTFPGYKDEVVTNGATRGFKSLRHVNKSSGVAISHTEMFCEEVPGSITLFSYAADNAAAPYTYRLTGPDGNVTTAVTEQPGHKFGGLMPGHYRIEGEDGNGCALESLHSVKTWSGNDTQEVDIVSKAISMQVTPVPATCGNQMGRIEVTVQGGAFKRDHAPTISSTGGYYLPGQYLFVNGAYVDNLNKDNTSLRSDSNFPANTTSLYKAAGTYEVKVADYLGCGVSRTVQLTAPAPITVQPVVTAATNIKSASVQLDASGGVPPYRFFTLRGDDVNLLRQDQRTFSNLKPGAYVAQVEDATGCVGTGRFTVYEPLTVTATVKDVTCVDDGVIRVVTTGGEPPFQYSIDGATFQENSLFEKLGAGSYVVTVKDAKNTKETVKANLKEPDEYVVEPSFFIPNGRVAAGDTNQAPEDGWIQVSYDENSRKTTFKLKAGFELKPLSSGVWQLTVTSTDPAEKALEGRYRAYFNVCQQNLFVGFYKEDYQGECETSQFKGADGKKMCKEGWLKEDKYAEIMKNIMIFANGYRDIDGIINKAQRKELPESNNLIETADIRNYWEGKDENFKSIRRPELSYYADGHHSITTSNHNVNNDSKKSQLYFLDSFASSLLAREPTIPNPTPVPIENPCYLKAECVVLHEIPNKEGFAYREQKGRQAYKNLEIKLLKVKKSSSTKVTYHIDIVAHSMGFAYAQGMIEEIKNASSKGTISVKWGGYYIIAPENGSTGSVTPSGWEQIWQYGSNLGQPNADPMWDQDGIAPQAAIQHINDDPTKGGRAFIPKTVTQKGFMDSHTIKNYGWIFDQPFGQPGYVTPK